MNFGLCTWIFVLVTLLKVNLKGSAATGRIQTKTKVPRPKFNLKLRAAQLQTPGIAFFSGRSSNNKTIAMNIAQPLRKIQNDEWSQSSQS